MIIYVFSQSPDMASLDGMHTECAQAWAGAKIITDFMLEGLIQYHCSNVSIILREKKSLSDLLRCAVQPTTAKPILSCQIRVQRGPSDRSAQLQIAGWFHQYHFS